MRKSQEAKAESFNGRDDSKSKDYSYSEELSKEIVEVSSKHYWFSTLAAVASLMSIECDLSLNVNKEEFALLAADHPIFGVYQHDLEYMLQKLTKTKHDEKSIEQQCSQLGLPPQIYSLIQRLQLQSGELMVSDG